MLSGISRKRSIRSNPYWFTEFCNSQCLSHFAAPFIVVRAETSVAESCKANGVERKPLEKIQVSTNVKFKRHRQRSERGYDGPLSPHTLPASPCTGASTYVSIPTQGLTEVRSHGLVGCVRMILPQVHLRKPCYDFSFL